MEFTSENLVKAVHEFYKTGGTLNAGCHNWLEKCQSSREAWTIVWPLLETNPDYHVQFMAANILHYKISRHLAEIPVEGYVALKDNLIAAVVRFVNGPSVVLSRLELALGVFIANTIGTIWPNPLEDLGNVFQPHNFPGVPEEVVIKLLIQVFNYVPEQAQSVWQSSSRHSKSEAHRQLQVKGESMFSWLFTIVKAKQNYELVQEALRAMVSWMKMISVCEWPNLTELMDILVNLCGESVNLGDHNLCEVCIEMLTAITVDQNTHHYPSVILLILDKILPLQSTLDKMLSISEMEMAGSIYAMYVSLAECHSRLIIDICDEENSHNKTNPQNRINALKLVDILLRCTATPGSFPIDETVSNLTISVWYSFVEEIQPKQSEGLKYARLMQVFEWVYKSLAEILIKKAQLPISEEAWAAEDIEQFRMYRQDVCDCLTYCFELRGWTMLNELIDAAERHLHIVDTTQDQIRETWPVLESLLMGIRAVTENISNDTDPLLVGPMTRAFEVIIRILKINQSFREPKLYQAAAECISSCSSMLHLFENKVKHIIGYILEGLFIRETSSSATLTLKAMSRDCTKMLSEFTPQILSSCKQALDSGSLSQNDSIRLVFCIGKFLPYLPHDQIITAVNEIFAPSLQHLHRIAGDNPKSEERSHLIVILRIMSTLCSSLDVDQCDSDEEEDMSESSELLDNNNYSSLGLGRVESPGTSASGRIIIEEVNPNVKPKKIRDASSQPLIPVVEQILPVLVPLAEKWSRDEEVMETLFSILKHTLSTIHASSQLVIEFAIKLVIISYRLHPVPPATLLAKQILLMLGRENFHMQCRFLQEIHGLCSHMLKNSRNNLDFTESYFQFIAQLIRQNTELVNASTISLDTMLVISMEILNYTEAPLLKAGVYFIYVTLEKASSLTPPLVEYYKNHGLILVQKIILAIGCLVPRASVYNFADIFVVLNKTFTGVWRKWLQDALSPPGFPSPHCSGDAKNKFFLKLTRDRATKRTVTDAINDFAIACRNISGTEYAAATTKSIYP